LAAETIPDNLLDYFHLVGEQEEGQGSIPAGDFLESASVIAERLETARFTDRQGFIDDLFSDREASWRKVLDAEELQGKALDGDTFVQVLERLQSDKRRLEDLAWLEALSRRLTHVQIGKLEATFRVQEQLNQQISHESLPLTERAQAGRVLGQFADHRKGVTVIRNADGIPLEQTNDGRKYSLPDIDWVEIPPIQGFMMGMDDEDAYDDEKPAHPVDVDAFSISRYPITNAQFRCFIEAGGYKKQQYWQTKAARYWLEGGASDDKLIADYPKKRQDSIRQGLGKDTKRFAPCFWNNHKWNTPNHPVVGVSWFEALAFCCWLAEVEGKSVRLPSEEEWEYAVRGVKGLKYAWGDEFSKEQGNTGETGLERTSAVGLFSQGKAVGPRAEEFGLSDMSGNVWEWTVNRWGKDFEKPEFTYADWQKQGKKEREDLNINELRVIRGGSWDNIPDFARCSFRYRFNPDLRYDNIGFRVVFSLADF
ncbi:MAG: formylglycine-generating enzyme family protein, partial [Candidatus Electrothrix sp. AR4]|nr:formylglycine-generating enzyme family protein [Candidatus Electrothrix sp. AR4]